jgi:molybdenum cofactor cytidylyltransferase
MKFGAVPIAEALGGVVAHAVRLDDLVLKKGVVIDAEHIKMLLARGVSEIVVALKEPGDLDEDVAALRIARAAAGREVAIEPPGTGRANLFAESAGLLIVDRAKVDAVNAIDEAITLATLEPMKRVGVGEMIATVKIIPFAVAGELVARAEALAGEAVRVAPFRARKVAVLSTLLPGLKASVVDKTLAVMGERLQELDFTSVDSDVRVPHAIAPLAAALGQARAAGAEMIVVFGASAITDRRDTIPAALEVAGGRIEHLGMPVDPGNLLLLGELKGTPVLGAPGCARSPKENGFDWVLQRLFAGVGVTRADIQAMGAGGLLMEIFSRPQPRSAQLHANHPQVAAVILAAGRSTRMGANKLLEMLHGKPIVRHVAEAALRSRAGPLIVVTGHQADAVSKALVGLDVTFVHNPAFADGLSSSLKVGVGAVPDTSAGALVLLGDMPEVRAETIDRLCDNFAGGAGAKAVVPVAEGRRANPVLIARGQFEALSAITGDTGARALLEAAGPDVIEVPVDDEGVLVDVDTPDALAALRGRNSLTD